MNASIRSQLQKMRKKADFWANGRSIDPNSKQKYYRTGEIAQILGLRDSKAVVRVLERGDLRGKKVNGRDGSGNISYWVVSQRALLEYIQTNRDAIEAGMNKEMDDFYAFLDESAVFLDGFKGLQESMRLVVSNLNPLTEMVGASADIRRMDALLRMLSTINRHTKLRLLFAKAKQ